MKQQEPDKCFVIMPFGIKPLKDGSGNNYDFDKVYRVIIKRAIRLAGMEPIRADEQTGAHIIHSDMFKELRDRAVVLADLSSENPNVYYELGIRHVLAPRGTVLICREGSDLPFDIKLSRVIFYKYDGRDLDWENAEQVVPQLQAALEEAKRGTPDSPVHALLETVFPQSHLAGSADSRTDHPNQEDTQAELEFYQKLVAEHLAKEEVNRDDIIRVHGKTAFGARVLGYLCLAARTLPEYAPKAASRLYVVEQYGLACDVYERLDAENRLSFDDLIRYGSAVSEKTRTLAAVDKGMELTRRAFDMVSAQAQDDAATPEQVSQVFKGYQSLSGMLLWRWMLTNNEKDLDNAIEMLQNTEAFVPVVTEKDHNYAIGRVAHLYLLLLLILRIRDATPDRPDSENHRDSILRLRPKGVHNPRELSYLRWYKAIALADAGDEVGVSRTVIEALRADDKLADVRLPENADFIDIGRRQYTLLRRFIEHYLNVLQNHALIGQISRALQVRQNG